MEFAICLLFLTFLTEFKGYHAQVPEVTDEIPPSTTAEPDLTEYITIHQDEVYNFLKDLGSYTRMDSPFKYAKGQELETEISLYRNGNLFPKMDLDTRKTLFCIKQYLKCLVNEGVRVSVCTIHRDYHYTWGFLTFPSACTMFMDNCRRDKRHWRVMDRGVCYLPYWNTEYQVRIPPNTPRRTMSLYNILDIKNGFSRFVEKILRR